MSGVPVALTIAGSDSGGGAGVQADLKTFAALGVYGVSVLTALTAQNTRGVQASHAIPPAFVVAQMESVLSDIRVDAAKIGMLATADVAEAVAEGLSRRQLPLVLDPVMLASSGDRLLDGDAVAVLVSRLFPLATVITPNLPEAAALLGRDIATTEDDVVRQGRALLGLGARAALMKGGHGVGDESVDWLVEPGAVTRFALPRIATRNTHGTGCTLSAAIAAGLARGLALEPAVAAAKSYLTDALLKADAIAIGRDPAQGHGPVHHFHRWW